MTHICVGNLTIVGSDNGLSPDRRQAIIWTNAGFLSIGLLRTYFSENLIKIQQFSLKKMHVKMASAKWRPSCLGLNMLNAERSLCCLDQYMAPTSKYVISNCSSPPSIYASNSPQTNVGECPFPWKWVMKLQWTRQILLWPTDIFGRVPPFEVSAPTPRSIRLHYPNYNYFILVIFLSRLKRLEPNSISWCADKPRSLQGHIFIKIISF